MRGLIASKYYESPKAAKRLLFTKNISEFI